MRHFIIVLFQIRLRRAIVRVGIGNRVVQIDVPRAYLRRVIPVTAYMRVAAYIPIFFLRSIHFLFPPRYAANGLQDSAAPTYERAEETA